MARLIFDRYRSEIFLARKFRTAPWQHFSRRIGEGDLARARPNDKPWNELFCVIATAPSIKRTLLQNSLDQETIMDEYEQYHEDGEAEAPSQPDGAFARINGGMLQSGKFANQIVSLVGNITAHDTIRTADGSEVKISTEHLAEAEGSGLIVDPNKAIEIMGQASGLTEITVRQLSFVSLLILY